MNTIIKWCIVLLLPFYCNNSIAQQRMTGYLSDTIIARTKSCTVMHYHEHSDERRKQLIKMSNNDIFSDNNKFSKLTIYKNDIDTVITISTIPLDDLVLLEDKQIIIGLSKIEASPYKIVMYRYDGSLFYKGNLGFKLINVDHKSLFSIKKSFPDLIKIFVESGNILKTRDGYNIEISNDAMRILNSPDFKTKFPSIIITIDNYIPFRLSTYWSTANQFHRIEGGYLDSSPFNEIISIKDSNYVLFLNDANGDRVPLHLISNCNLNIELQE